ncbi:hypothetical protein FPZ12_029570 [Amycolatopsis acidicola]|uniref:HK97 gp10 family phage protein n=1 Tax=Amycolatopsis acidicola TaxID=2596893 RepID=A0A5N0UTI9_9PSEU|nr:DUF5403 family protein [Amycolatopsis acidicola]KAA9155547.1 hypothetical protein FPZ12_029570 [Amycolatopsis acidicola]
MKVSLRAEKTLNRWAARDSEVEAALGDIAYEILGKARANLEKHHKTGVHRITQTKGKVDHYVNLVGPSSTSVEFGHHTKNGEWVEGLHILKDAL